MLRCKCSRELLTLPHHIFLSPLRILPAVVFPCHCCRDELNRVQWQFARTDSIYPVQAACARSFVSIVFRKAQKDLFVLKLAFIFFLFDTIFNAFLVRCCKIQSNYVARGHVFGFVTHAQFKIHYWKL